MVATLLCSALGSFLWVVPLHHPGALNGWASLSLILQMWRQAQRS